MVMTEHVMMYNKPNNAAVYRKRWESEKKKKAKGTVILYLITSVH